MALKDLQFETKVTLLKIQSRPFRMKEDVESQEDAREHRFCLFLDFDSDLVIRPFF